ncbi:LCP family protein [Streptomyces sp. Z26]|uniref:LCP family protein n=1 Tax=Streptomyces sp. Z26 TaxID=2500177 RepID=UPI001F0B8D90|nr:LCP family protein [Streptomyces sp. Z26]
MTETGTLPTDEAPPPPAPPERGRRRWLRWAALGTAVLVVAGAGVGWAFYEKLDGNIRTDRDTAEELARHEDERPVGTGEAQDILLLGSDSRDGDNTGYGPGGSERADTTILLHLPADRSHATAVSLPRDLMVDIPGCGKPDGGTTRPQFAQFNWAFEFGGAACTIRTVEKLTGVRVDHHLIVDFSGFKELVDSLGGVEVCLREPVRDQDAQLDLDAGRQTLHGEEALGFVRARKGFDGSDTQRMDRQQQFLGSLVKKTRSDGVLLNPAKLYPVLDSATSSLTADTGLDSLRELYDLTRSVRGISEEKVRFLTVPRQPYALNANRDELVQPAAERLFTLLRNDQPVPVGEKTDDATPEPGASDGTPSAAPGAANRASLETGPSASASPSAPPSPDGSGDPSPDASPDGGATYRGTTAARDVCAQGGAGNGAD